MEYWFIYIVLIVTLLAFDLGVLNRKDKVMSFQKSLYLSLFYFTVACIFGVYIHYAIGSTEAKEYYTGFLIEKAMSLDNIFVISIIFKFFDIPEKYQHRVLFWGILGVILMRAVMIGLGAMLIAKFGWILYIFAIILILTGGKLLYLHDKEFKVQDLFIYRFLRDKLNMTSDLHGHHFFIFVGSSLYVTPLFVALLLIESIDVVFAIDSIPAIFAITNDTYVVYTSNIFAVLGLRALFFCLNGLNHRFAYIKHSVALILVFIGAKIFINHFIPIPTYFSLITIIVLLAGGVAASALKKA